MAYHWGDAGPLGSAKVQLKAAEENELVMPKIISDNIEEAKIPKKPVTPSTPEEPKVEGIWEDLLARPHPSGAPNQPITRDQVVQKLKVAAGLPTDPAGPSNNRYELAHSYYNHMFSTGMAPTTEPKEVTCLDEHLDEVRPKIFRETFASRRPGSLLTHDSVDEPQPLATPPTPNTVEKGNQMWSDFNYKPLPNAQTSSNSKFPTDPASVLKIFRANADEMRIKSESEMREKDTKAPDDNINDSPAKDSKK